MITNNTEIKTWGFFFCTYACKYLQKKKFLKVVFFYGLTVRHSGTSFLQPGIEPMPPAPRAWSLNHWTSREVPQGSIFFDLSPLILLAMQLPIEPFLFTLILQIRVFMTYCLNYYNSLLSVSVFLFSPLCVCACSVASVVSDSVTLCTVAHQAPLSMRFSGQEYWTGLPCPPPGDLSNPGTEPASPTLKADSLLLNRWRSLTLSFIISPK